MKDKFGDFDLFGDGIPLVVVVLAILVIFGILWKVFSLPGPDAPVCSAPAAERRAEQ